MKYHPAWRYWGLSTIGCLALAACDTPAEAPAPGNPPTTEQPKGEGKGDPCGRRGNNPDVKCP